MKEIKRVSKHWQLLSEQVVLRRVVLNVFNTERFLVWATTSTRTATHASSTFTQGQLTSQTGGQGFHYTQSTSTAIFPVNRIVTGTQTSTMIQAPTSVLDYQYTQTHNTSIHHHHHQQQQQQPYNHVINNTRTNTNPNHGASTTRGNSNTTTLNTNPKLKHIQYIELKYFNIPNRNGTNAEILSHWGTQLTIIFDLLLNLKGIIFDDAGCSGGVTDMLSSIVRKVVVNKRDVWTHLNVGTVDLGDGGQNGGNSMKWCLDLFSPRFNNDVGNHTHSPAWGNLRVLKLDLSKTPVDIIHDFESLGCLGNVTTMIVDLVMGLGTIRWVPVENGHRRENSMGVLYNLLLNLPMSLKKLKLDVDADEIFALGRCGSGDGGCMKMKNMKRLVNVGVLQLYIGRRRVFNYGLNGGAVDTYSDTALVSGLRVLFGWFFPNLKRLMFSLDRFDSPRFIGVYESSTSNTSSNTTNTFADMVSSTLIHWTLIPSSISAGNPISLSTTHVPQQQQQQQRIRIHPLLNPDFYTNLTHLHLRSGQSALSHLNPSTAPFWQRLDSLSLDVPGPHGSDSDTDIYTYVDELIDMVNAASNIRYLGFGMGLASRKVDGFRELLKVFSGSCEKLRWVRLFDRTEPVRLGHVGMVGGDYVATGHGVVDVMLELVCWVSGVKWLHCDWIGRRVDGSINMKEGGNFGRSDYLKWEVIAEQVGILVLGGVGECRYDPLERVEYPRRVFDV
ncbi:hypothetical protein HDU76_000667 [Blyttiomyces sp. JEL0837]|nr:hypothetical protein HDU76_000667 [Blyttiomyces sp. JEL0837]